MRLSRFLSFAITCTLSIHGAMAQEADPGTGKTGKTYFKLTSLGEWQGHALYVNVGKAATTKKMREVEILDMGYSPAMRYNKGAPIRFFRKTGMEEPEYEAVLSVKVPESCRQPLILLAFRGKKISHAVYDIAPAVFPYGACQVANLSPAELRVAMDDDLRPLPPRRVQMFKPVKGEATRSWLRVGAQGHEKLLFSSMMMRRSEKRMLVFLLPGSDANGRRTMKTRMLVDFKPMRRKAD